MTGEQFSASLRTLSLSNPQAADWLGVSERSIERWRKDGVRGPVVAAIEAAKLYTALLPEEARMK